MRMAVLTPDCHVHMSGTQGMRTYLRMLQGRNALWFALLHAHIQVVKVLLAHKASVIKAEDIEVRITALTVLYTACSSIDIGGLDADQCPRKAKSTEACLCLCGWV